MENTQVIDSFEKFLLLCIHTYAKQIIVITRFREMQKSNHELYIHLKIKGIERGLCGFASSILPNQIVGSSRWYHLIKDKIEELVGFNSYITKTPQFLYLKVHGYGFNDYFYDEIIKSMTTRIEWCQQQIAIIKQDEGRTDQIV